MGWASGSRVAESFIRELVPRVEDEDTRAAIYKPFIRSLEGEDWDTQDDVIELDPAFDQALKDLHPTWRGDEHI